MLRGIWIVKRQDGYIPVSRRFPLAERKHKKQVAAAAIDNELPKSSGAPIPNDVDLGACVLRKLNEVSNTTTATKYKTRATLFCLPKHTDWTVAVVLV